MAGTKERMSRGNDHRGKAAGHGSAIPPDEDRPVPIKAAKRLYSVQEAAGYLGLSGWTVRELIWKGELPHVRVCRRILLDVQDLDALILRNKIDES